MLFRRLVVAFLFLFLIEAFGGERRTVIVVPREMMQRGYYYKGDCEAVGIIVHCKDFWFEIDGYKPEGRK